MDTAVAKGRSPLAASLTTCALLLKHSPWLLGLNVAGWTVVEVFMIGAKLPALTAAMALVAPLAAMNLMFLRAELMMGPALLPATRGAQSVAVAAAASALTLGGMVLATLVTLPFAPPDVAAFVFWVALGAALSIAVDLPVSFSWISGRPVLLGRVGFALLVVVTMLQPSTLLKVTVLGWILHGEWKHRAKSKAASPPVPLAAVPAVRLDFSGVRTPEGALRVLLGGQWEWLVLVVAVPVAVWLALTVQGATDLGWEGVSYGLAGLVSLLLPVSPLGMAAATEALRLPLSPLMVQHAVLRAAAIRAVALFSGLSVVTAVVMAAEGASPAEIAAMVSWSVPLSAVAVGSAAWTLHPRSLGVTAVRLAFASVIPLPLLAAFVSDRRLEAGLVIGAVGLLALVTGEVWARAALTPRRTS